MFQKRQVMFHFVGVWPTKSANRFNRRFSDPKFFRVLQNLPRQRGNRVRGEASSRHDLELGSIQS